MGLCQFLPGTWSDVQKKYPSLDNPYDARQSITAAAVYMGQLNRGWSSPRPTIDRYKLALASYNAGFGNLLKAQELSGGGLLYATIVARLPEVTGRHSLETTDYVDRIIYRHWVRILFR